jgi:hypothetical protein
MKTKDLKKIFEDFFLRTLNEQSLIRNEMIGHKVVAIYYAPKVDGWDIDIKDFKHKRLRPQGAPRPFMLGWTMPLGQ